MPKKKPKKVLHELENNTSYKGLDEEAEGYLDQFNREWYYGTRYTGGKYNINTDDDGRKICNRNNNVNNRDAMSVAERMGTLVELTTNERDFMEQASDEWEWQDIYKAHGKEAATKAIFDQARRDIEGGVLDLNVILSRFVVKMFNLKTVHERKRKQRKDD